MGGSLPFKEYFIGHGADPRHIEVALQAYVMEDCKSIGGPWAAEPHGDKVDLNLRCRMDQSDRTAEDEWMIEDEAEALDYDGMKTYQSTGARLNYLCIDRTDTQFAVKEIMRKMYNTNVVDEQWIKRTLRYLRGVPRVIYTFPLGGIPDDITVYVDSNFAGCGRSRNEYECWCYPLGCRGCSRLRARPRQSLP